jgi:hypothetical protein
VSVVVVLLTRVRGITMTGCEAISCASPFANNDNKGGGRKSNDGPGWKINELSPNRKHREPSDYRELASVNQMVEGRGDAIFLL